MLRFGLLANVLLWTVLALAVPAQAGVHEAAAGSCCWVLINDEEHGWRQGTGWILNREKGWILTSEHVVGKHEEARIYLSHWEGETLVRGSKFYWQKVEPIFGKVLKVDVKRDLALIEVPQIAEGYRELKLAAASPNVGDKLFFVGNSDATGQKIDNAMLWHFGEVKVDVVGFRLHPRDTGGTTQARVVQVKGKVRHGDSGGPMVNQKGELVGIISAVSLKETGVAMLTDVTEVRRFVERYENGPPAIDPASPLLGRWHVTEHFPGKEKSYLAMDILPEGKGLIEGKSQIADGTYTLEEDRLLLDFPDINLKARGAITWDGLNRFVLKFSNAEYEYLRDE